MKNSLNNRQRLRMGLTDIPSLLRFILGWALFVEACEQVKKKNEEKERYAEKRRGDLMKEVA